MYRLQKGELGDFLAASVTRIGNRGGRCFWREKTDIFSTLDMFSGYRQVKMANDSKKFTGFTTPDGEHLTVNRLCFGLCNAPAHFMCAIQGLFQHYINRYCQVYLDDVIIFCKQHIVELRDTLHVLKKQG